MRKSPVPEFEHGAFLFFSTHLCFEHGGTRSRAKKQFSIADCAAPYLQKPTPEEAWVFLLHEASIPNLYFIRRSFAPQSSESSQRNITVETP